MYLHNLAIDGGQQSTSFISWLNYILVQNEKVVTCLRNISGTNHVPEEENIVVRSSGAIDNSIRRDNHHRVRLVERIEIGSSETKKINSGTIAGNRISQLNGSDTRNVHQAKQTKNSNVVLEYKKEFSRILLTKSIVALIVTGAPSGEVLWKVKPALVPAWGWIIAWYGEYSTKELSPSETVPFALGTRTANLKKAEGSSGSVLF
jgi:hypothetical protein